MIEPAHIQISFEADDDGVLAAAIEQGLVESLRRNMPPNNYEPLVVIARSDAAMVGGLVGATSYGWLLVKMLWVAAQLRRRGLGARLMAEAEALARARGCHAAWLDTSSADAERFYRRLGYAPFGVLENAGNEQPPGHRRAFLHRRFT